MVVGIDLGTTNSVVAIYEKGSTSRVVSIYGHETTPSVVGWNPKTGKLVVGHEAKKRILIDSETTISSNKRFMGDRKKEYRILKNAYSPVDITAFLLKYLIEGASKSLKSKITKAVITVPAYFNITQKEDTLKAAKQAGIQPIMLQAEPTAAAIAYGLDKEKDQTILVYDLGGGTFDVSILEVVGNRFTVKATGGNMNLGGDDFDNTILNFLYGEIRKDLNFDLKKDKSNQAKIAKQSLKELVEEAKKELTDSSRSDIIASSLMGKGDFEYELTRKKFKSLIDHYLQETLAIVKQTIVKAKLTDDDINRMICVGGSTKSPVIKDFLTKELRTPYMAGDLDKIVAYGAAITAYYETNKDNDRPVEISNITPFDLGIRIKKKGINNYCEPLILQQSQIPYTITKDFKTVKDDQSMVQIAVYQGNNKLFDQNTFIGGFELSGIPTAKAGSIPIKVKFQLNKSDTLEVTATCNHITHTKILKVNKVEDVNNLSTGQGGEVDIVFLIDTSGSMSSELKGVKQSCIKFAEYVKSHGINCRLGLIDFDWSGYGDHKYEIFKLQSKPQTFQKNIQSLRIGRIGGGGCYVGHPSTLTVFKGVPHIFNRKNRNKILILISDEVGGVGEGSAYSSAGDITSQIITVLKQHSITTHVVGVPGKNAHAKIAKATNGKFWDIFKSRGIDFSQLLKNIAQEIALTT